MSKLRGKTFEKRRLAQSKEPVDVGQDMRIDRHNLQRECAEHPGLFAWYVQLWTRAKLTVQTYERAEKRIAARALEKMQIAEQDKPLRERRSLTVLRQRLVLRKDVCRAQEATAAARALREELETLFKPLAQRGEMLKSLSIMQQREQKDS